MLRKYYVYLRGITDNMQLTEGQTKDSKSHITTNSDPLILQQPFKPSPILVVLPLTENMLTKGIWFTDVSTQRIKSI